MPPQREQCGHISHSELKCNVLNVDIVEDIENAEIAVNAEVIEDAEIVSISQILDMHEAMTIR